MRILKMRASFGKLQGELSLSQGLNLLCLPNESGKSTWCAFLIAMLYGIDSSEKASKANQGLPEKLRYKPWDGGAMEGAVELIWNGRFITIERRSTGRIPMGDFAAYDTQSGVAISTLTGENCGRTLCGVERSVFERTAFIRQLGLGVTSDAALEQRLNALVTTGEEGVPATELLAKLRDMQNKCSRSGTGQIAKKSQRLQELEDKRKGLRAAQDEAMELRAKCKQAQARVEACEALQARMERANSAKKQRELSEMARQTAAQEALCQELSDECSALPDESQVAADKRALESAENELRTAQLESALSISPLTPPAVPAYFANANAQEAAAQVQRDLAEYRRLSAVREQNKLLPLSLCAALIALGAGLCLVSLFIGLPLCAIGIAALLISIFRLSRRSAQVREELHQAALIPLRYGVRTADEIPALATRYAQSVAEFEEKRAALDAQKAEYAARIAEINSRIDAVLRSTARFAPQVRTGEDCLRALGDALRAHERLGLEQRTLKSMRQQLASMRQLLGDVQDAQQDEEALGYDPLQVSYELRQAAQRLASLQQQLAHLQGQISAFGEDVSLSAEIELLTQQISDLQDTDRALSYAIGAVKAADDRLRSRFSPQIAADAGELFSRLTDGKYSKLLLSPDMSLSAQPQGGAVMHPAAALSCGAADQMYLALRLAMCKRLLPNDAPLIFDDALLSFDDARAKTALALLAEESAQRQIILFTCQTREERFLQDVL
ncbi:MAG: hypothetical protein LBM28_06905 [Oscillospiraceae bacterium]|jgi:uncharacterized protein YhaN|nr:hypothetical protein [Oscillospiraceae bacterium]